MSNNTNLIAGIIGGAAAGLAVGMLYAPDKGSETRRKIREKAVDVKDNLVEKTNNIAQKITENIGSGKSELERSLDDVIHNMIHTTYNAITTLENKLEQLKK